MDNQSEDEDTPGTRILRLPPHHQFEALGRLSETMTAEDLSDHRLQVCRILKHDLHRLEDELGALLSGSLAEAVVRPDTIARAQKALEDLRLAIDQVSMAAGGVIDTPSLPRPFA